MILHGDGARNEGSIHSECYSLKGCGHLPDACWRRSDVAGLGNAFFVLDFTLDVLDGVGRLNFQSNGFAGEGFDEDLHFGNLFSKELFEMNNWNRNF